MLAIDGSYGEGGGQILRSSLALSLVTGQPFRIEKIRAGRERPGLMRQHLTAVEAAARVGQAAVDGAAVGSKELTFRPGKAKAGEYTFSVGTAGSATLVLQTVLPALLLADGESVLTLEGGTHNPFAPPYDFLAGAFLPIVNMMGPKVGSSLSRHGFYPAGGGRFQVMVAPAPKLQPVELTRRDEIRVRRARALVANLPLHIAERELQTVAELLGWDRRELHAEEIRGCAGPGNVLILEVENDRFAEVFAGFGERGVKAETVARRTAAEAKEYLDAGVPVGAHLADQLIVPLALAGGGAYSTLPLTQHSKTNMDVIRRFVDVDIDATEGAGGSCLVEVRGRRS